MESARAQEQIAGRDLPRGDVRGRSFCAVLSWYSHTAAAVRVSYLLHEFLLGTLTNGGQGTKQKSTRLRFLAWILRIGCRARRHCAATDPVKTFNRGNTFSRHGDIRRGRLEPRDVARAG